MICIEVQVSVKKSAQGLTNSFQEVHGKAFLFCPLSSEIDSPLVAYHLIPKRF